jgi:hypothetical protein
MLNQIKLIGLLLLLSSNDFLAQEYLLKVEQAVDSLEPKSGKNRKNYWHNYIGYGLIIGASDQGAATVPISSREFLFGARYKRKLSNTFAIGYDLLYKFQAYRLVQDSLKTLPSPLLNSRERMIFHHFSAAPYFRINFNPLRGNKLGRFIDLGAYGDFIFAHVLFQKNELSSGIITRTRSTRHGYFNRLNYGALLRLGSDRFTVYGAFRLSDIFFPSLVLPELSRITLGLQLNLN